MKFSDLKPVAPDIERCETLAELLQIDGSGIYFLLSGEEVVYVGQAGVMRSRIGQHMQDGLKDFDGVAFMPAGLADLDAKERLYIEACRPKYNNCGLSKMLRASEAPIRRLVVEQRRRPRTREAYTLVRFM